MFAFYERHGQVELAFTDRHGGVSVGSYASLNLAASGGDEPNALAENLDRVAHALARGGEPSPGDPWEVPPGTPLPRVVGMRQVHGADVAVAGHDTEGDPAVDALVTVEPGVALLVRVADCVPVVLADTEAGVIGVVHAGRRGMVAGVVPAAVEALRRLGGARRTGGVGPHVCGRCYEVPEQMRDEIAAVVPESAATTSWGKPALDLGAGVRAQLGGTGVTVVDRSRCTREDPNLYSFRRDGVLAGRCAGLVWMRPGVG